MESTAWGLQITGVAKLPDSADALVGLDSEQPNPYELSPILAPVPDDVPSVTITGGEIDSIQFSDAEQIAHGTVTVSVTNPVHQCVGWSIAVSVQLLIGDQVMDWTTLSDVGELVTLAALTLVDLDTGASIQVSALSLLPAGPIDVRLGQSVDDQGGPFIRATVDGLPLSESQTLMVADPGYGNGVHRSKVHVQLTIPGGTPTGTCIPSWSIGVSANTI
jgi:hypothetical protein